MGSEQTRRQVLMTATFEYQPGSSLGNGGLLDRRNDNRLGSRIVGPLVVANAAPPSPTVSEWLKLREKFHKEVTEETIILRDKFDIPEEMMERRDIIPSFRPAGATHQMAIEWKKKLLGVETHEEMKVTECSNFKGPAEPELHFLRCSITPDESTFGKSLRSPPEIKLSLIGQCMKKWASFYEWSDADNLHFEFFGKHFDSGYTSTWFLSHMGDKFIARGRAPDRNVGVYWGYGELSSNYGLRSLIPIERRPDTNWSLYSI